MRDSPGVFFILGAAFSAIAALVHVGCIVFGASWYRFVGAGEPMAQLAANGRWYPTIVTSFIAIVLAIWSAYALSGAGLIPKLPLLRPALCAITSIYFVRGVAGLSLTFYPMGRTVAFWWWSSAICLAIAALHFAGLVQSWSQL